MAALLVAAFLLVPVVEIYVIIQVGQLIGPLPTVALLVIESLIGAWLIKREGRAAWAALREGAASGRLPARELADAALVVVGGTLLLTPGFVTDVVGFFFVLPLTRPLARRALAWFVARRAARVVGRQVHWRATMDPRASDRGGPPSWVDPLGSPRLVLGETVADDGSDLPPDKTGPDDTGPDKSGPDSKGPGRATGG
jgi:UPF0716 protein FxsA